MGDEKTTAPALSDARRKLIDKIQSRRRVIDGWPMYVFIGLFLVGLTHVFDGWVTTNVALYFGTGKRYSENRIEDYRIFPSCPGRLTTS